MEAKRVLLLKSKEMNNDRLFLKIDNKLVEISYDVASALEYQLREALSDPTLDMSGSETA